MIRYATRIRRIDPFSERVWDKGIVVYALALIGAYIIWLCIKGLGLMIANEVAGL